MFSKLSLTSKLNVLKNLAFKLAFGSDGITQIQINLSTFELEILSMLHCLISLWHCSIIIWAMSSNARIAIYSWFLRILRRCFLYNWFAGGNSTLTKECSYSTWRNCQTKKGKGHIHYTVQAAEQIIQKISRPSTLL